jgi:tellurite resistance protein
MKDPGDILRTLIAAASTKEHSPLEEGSDWATVEGSKRQWQARKDRRRLAALAKYLGPLRGMAEAVREGLDALILDEDLTDAKLRDAAERLLPRLADKARAAELALDAALLERERDGN